MCKVGGPRSGRILIKINKYILFCNKVPIDRNLSAITIFVRFHTINTSCRLVLVIVFVVHTQQEKTNPTHIHTHKTSPFAVGFFGSLEKDDCVLILSVSLSNQF